MFSLQYFRTGTGDLGFTTGVEMDRRRTPLLYKEPGTEPSRKRRNPGLRTGYNTQGRSSNNKHLSLGKLPFYSKCITQTSPN